MPVSIEVEISPGLRTLPARFRANLERALDEVAAMGIGELTQASYATPFKHTTGAAGYSGSHHLIEKAEGIRSIGPGKAYAGWLEDGSDSPFAPQTHRQSAFKGYHIVAKAEEKIGQKAVKIIAEGLTR